VGKSPTFRCAFIRDLTVSHRNLEDSIWIIHLPGRLHVEKHHVRENHENNPIPLSYPAFNIWRRG